MKSKKENNILKEFIKLKENSKVKMTANGDEYIYSVYKEIDNSYNLRVDDKIMYGLSCSSVIDMIGVLIQDYANGIITNFEII